MKQNCFFTLHTIPNHPNTESFSTWTCTIMTHKLLRQTQWERISSMAHTNYYMRKCQNKYGMLCRVLGEMVKFKNIQVLFVSLCSMNQAECKTCYGTISREDNFVSICYPVFGENKYKSSRLVISGVFTIVIKLSTKRICNC